MTARWLRGLLLFHPNGHRSGPDPQPLPLADVLVAATCVGILTHQSQPGELAAFHSRPWRQRAFVTAFVADPALARAQVTAAAPAGPAAFEEQRQRLRSVAQFDAASRTWWAYVGVLDVRALKILQRLYGAAQRVGTGVRVEVVAAPDAWSGPCSTEAGEMASLVATEADRARLLGQLHVT